MLAELSLGKDAVSEAAAASFAKNAARHGAAEQVVEAADGVDFFIFEAARQDEGKTKGNVAGVGLGDELGSVAMVAIDGER